MLRTSNSGCSTSRLCDAGRQQMNEVLVPGAGRHAPIAVPANRLSRPVQRDAVAQEQRLLTRSEPIRSSPPETEATFAALPVPKANSITRHRRAKRPKGMHVIEGESLRTGRVKRARASNSLYDPEYAHIHTGNCTRPGCGATQEPACQLLARCIDSQGGIDWLKSEI